MMYEPTLDELPAVLDNRKYAGPILNQGREGACVGFGLAAVANYLIWNRTKTRAKPIMISPRMLYEMTKRYDEWQGEHYDGTSLRGAMKGWNKHGVCPETAWPYDPKDGGRLTPQRQEAALRFPLGAYYRVRHLHLNHMQSAINTVGVLCASALAHSGWDRVDATGHIPYRNDPIEGHSFAMIGYDAEGFWIQNSWGTDWGAKGFGHLSYDDWLENGYDCWVARLGVVTTAKSPDGAKADSRVLTFGYIPHQAAVLNEIRLNYVNLGNDGRFSRSGLYGSDEGSVGDIIDHGLATAARQWGGPTTKLFLYAHGGLVDENAAAIGISRMRSHFLDNRIYPIHFMWETGLLESLHGILEDALRRERFQGWRDELRDRFQDLLDEAIELASRPFGLAVWNEMKDNADRASRSQPEGGAAYLVRRLAKFAREEGPLEIHLAGHSAGAIFHSYLVPQFIEAGLPIKTLTLLAPACTTALFAANVVRHVRTNVERLTIFNLTDKTEQDDNVTALYNKSILYLVSEAFEPTGKTPLLGLEKCLAHDASLLAKVGAGRPAGEPTIVHSVGGPKVTLASNAHAHVDFDNDAATLNSTLRIVRGDDRITGSF